MVFIGHNWKQSTTTPYHAMANGITENFNKTIKNLLKKVAAERSKDWHRYLGPMMFAVCDTPQDSTGFTPFELLYGYRVRTPMTLLKRIWTVKRKIQKMNCQRYRFETRSIIIEEPESESSMLGTVCHCCCPLSRLDVWEIVITSEYDEGGSKTSFQTPSRQTPEWG